MRYFQDTLYLTAQRRRIATRGAKLRALFDRVAWDVDGVDR